MAIESSESPGRQAFVLGAFWAVVLVLSCSGTPEAPPVSSGAPVADVLSPPAGVADRGDDPAVVAIDSGGSLPCAGALVAPDVVLTALHCVALLEAPIACDADGAPGPMTSLSLREPQSLRIFVGDAMASAVERARGRGIVAPPGGRLCGADIALVLLDQPIDEVQPLVVRSTGAARGDHVRTVGFGPSGVPRSRATKLLRDHVTVVDTTATELEIAEAVLDEGGGPALDETTATIVGVVSRNALGADALDVYTRVDAFTTLIASALAESETGTSSGRGTEKPKKGPADLGANCETAVDCAAGVCVSAASGAKQYCSRGCSSADRCPTLYGCQRSRGGDQVCVQK